MYNEVVLQQDKHCAFKGTFCKFEARVPRKFHLLLNSVDEYY